MCDVHMFIKMYLAQYMIIKFSHENLLSPKPKKSLDAILMYEIFTAQFYALFPLVLHK